MKINKIVIATLLAMCVIGFSMASISGADYKNYMEVNKYYFVDVSGCSLTPGDSFNMNYWDVVREGGAKDNSVFRDYTTGWDMSTGTGYGFPVVEVKKIHEDDDLFSVRPLVHGTFMTKTKHPIIHDKTYEWVFN